MARICIRFLVSSFFAAFMIACVGRAACASPGRCPYTLAISPSDSSLLTYNLSFLAKRNVPNHQLHFQLAGTFPSIADGPTDTPNTPGDTSTPPIPSILAIDLPAPPDLGGDPPLSGPPTQVPSPPPEIASTTTIDETETETETVTLVSTSTATATTTQTRTIAREASTVTVSLSLPPETVTDTVVVTMLPSSLSAPNSPHTTSPPKFSHPSPSSLASSSPSPAPSPSAHLPPLEGKEVWIMPKDLEDMGPFNVTSFPGDGKNLKIVSGIPPKASITPNQRVSPAKASSDVDDDNNTNTSSKSQTLYPLRSWSSSTTSLQLFYPEGSINPAQKPKGGEEFYASPLDISTARNVSLRYSVYFPSDFDWVLAGKLPGLYGGHTGCSGGNAALDCFSTRLMWRAGGAGELYLYAAKDKQPTAMCSDPRSECNAQYGFSIGRGSFTWAAGAWTTVVQTVVLNTPGRQDGAFTLDVNGKRVIQKHGVFYRDVLWPPSGSGKEKSKSTEKVSSTRPVSATTTVAPTPTKGSDPLGDILGPLLSEITHILFRRAGPTPTMSIPIATGKALATENTVLPTIATPEATHLNHIPQRLPHLPDNLKVVMVQHDDEDVRAMPSHDDADDEADRDEDDMSLGIWAAAPQREGNSIGFIGLFFSTFFGGHDEKYATPKDQYVWFTDFALSYND